MFNKRDIHYHVTGRNIKNDIVVLQEYIDKENMEEVVVMATYFPENGSGVSNYNLYHHIQDIPQAKMYLSLDFKNYFFMGFNEIEHLLMDANSRKKIYGVKIYTGYQKVDFNSEEFKLVMGLAKKYKLVVMFHTGYLKGNKEQFNPLLLEEVINKYAEIKIIIAHLGNPFINETIYLLNKYSNLFTDISGLVDKRVEIEHTVGLVKKVAKQVPSFKLLFGTDYPMQDYKTTLIFEDAINGVKK